MNFLLRVALIVFQCKATLSVLLLLLLLLLLFLLWLLLLLLLLLLVFFFMLVLIHVLVLLMFIWNSDKLFSRDASEDIFVTNVSSM